MTDLNAALADLEQRMNQDKPQRTHKHADAADMQTAVVKAMDAALFRAEIADVEVRSFDA